MSQPTYSVLTWDCETGRFTPQEGLSVPCIDVSLQGVRAALKELKTCGYTCNRKRFEGRYDNSDPAVLVERTDDAPSHAAPNP